MRVLNVEVSAGLLRRWAGWLAPARQPFYLTPGQAAEWGLEPDDTPTDAHQRDTFEVYYLTAGVRATWLDESTFLALPRAVRGALVRAQVRHGRAAVPTVPAWSVLLPGVREQADGHRFVWWPSLLVGRAEAVLAPVVGRDLLASRHDEVPASTWSAATGVLPRARALAGTFATGSGPNCFGTVLGAVGVRGVDRAWVQRAPFEEFLATRTRPSRTRCDGDPGTVLVWRDAGGHVQHAAVTLGDGWALHKPSQSWMSPRTVLAVPELLAFSRQAGRYLHRYALVG